MYSAGEMNPQTCHNKNGTDNVTIVEMADHVLPNILDEDLAKIVEKHLQDKGVRLRLGEKLVGPHDRDLYNL